MSCVCLLLVFFFVFFVFFLFFHFSLSLAFSYLFSLLLSLPFLINSYGLTNPNDRRPSSLMDSNTSSHSGVDLRIAVYQLMSTCVLLPTASGLASGGSLLGHALRVYHDGLNDGDHRVVSICRRSILALRSILHPTSAPMREFEPKIAPLAKRYKTAWPTTTTPTIGSTMIASTDGGGGGGGGGSKKQRGGGEDSEEVMVVVTPAVTMEVDDTPIEVEKIAFEVMGGNGEDAAAVAAAVAAAAAQGAAEGAPNLGGGGVEMNAEEDDDEDFPDIVA